MGCGGNSKKMPGWTTRSANLGKAVARWALAGFPTVTDAVYRQRLDQCQACELLVDDTKCSHPQCGCFVARKASLATEACPIGKWTAETENVVHPAPKPASSPARVAKPSPTPADQATCAHRPIVHSSFSGGSVTIRVVCQRCAAAMLIDGLESATHSVTASSGSASS